MQKRQQGKLGGGAGGATAPPAKRGQPFGSTSNNVAASVAADTIVPSTLLGPSLHVHSSFAGQFSKTLREKVLIFAKKNLFHGNLLVFKLFLTCL